MPMHRVSSPLRVPHAHLAQPVQQQLPVVTAVSLVPAFAGALVPPQRVIFESAAGPPTRIFLKSAFASGFVPPALVVQDRVLRMTPGFAGSAGIPFILKIVIPPPPQPVRPAWQRDVQHWAITQERQRHVQALWQYGELAVFVLMWTTLDEKAGLVGRCQRCFLGTQSTPDVPVGAITDVGGSATLRGSESRIAAAYGQGNQYLCPDCFGTQFEGGFRAMIVRPALFSDLDRDQRKTSHAVVNTGETQIETTPDFRVRSGDYCFRQSGLRLRLRVPKRTTLRTGFGTPYQQSASIDYNLLRAAVEDPSTAAYIIPPDANRLHQVLGTYTRIPVDYSWFEVIRAPLIPEDDPSPASSGALQPTATFPE